MRATFICQACRGFVLAPPSLAGESMTCPKCGADVDRWPAPVPLPAPPPVPPARRDDAGDEYDDGYDRPRHTERRGFNPMWAVGIVAAIVLAAIMVPFVWTGARSPGTRLAFNGGELFYTSSVTRAEAERLGNYLVAAGFFDGELKSVQLTREGRRYLFRMVVKKGIENDPQALALMRLLAAELSREVFAHQPIDVHLCDEYFRTLRVVVNVDLG